MTSSNLTTLANTRKRFRDVREPIKYTESAHTSSHLVYAEMSSICTINNPIERKHTSVPKVNSIYMSISAESCIYRRVCTFHWLHWCDADSGRRLWLSCDFFSLTQIEVVLRLLPLLAGGVYNQWLSLRTDGCKIAQNFLCL